MKELQVWITYHDDTQIEDFGLAEDGVLMPKWLVA